MRDLIVDKTKITDRVSRILARQRAFDLTVEEVKAPVDASLPKKLEPLEYCARCGVCTAACPVVEQKGLKSYIGPTGMMLSQIDFTIRTIKGTVWWRLCKTACGNV